MFKRLRSLGKGIKTEKTTEDVMSNFEVVFDRELFKRSVLYNVKTLYRKTIEEATDQQIFHLPRPLTKT